MMLKQTQVIVNWSGPYDFIDAIDNASSLNADFAGVYVHRFTNLQGKVLERYVGKHTRSISDRLGEHGDRYLKGDFRLRAPGGGFAYSPYDPAYGAYDDRKAAGHISCMQVYVGELHTTRSIPLSYLAGDVEALLMRSRTWRSQSQINLNRRVEKGFEKFERFEVFNVGASAPAGMFGTNVVWDRQAWQVS